MLKKLMNFFMDEEEVIDEIEENKSSNFIDIEDKELDIPKITKPKVEQKEETIKEIKAEVKEETIIEKPKSTFINLENKKNADIEDTVKPLNVYRSNNTTRVQEYEFTQNISPIFGTRGESLNTKDNKPEKINEKRKVVNTSVLGTVISPVFGIEKKKEVSMTNHSQNNVENKIETPMNIDSEELHYNNLSLDDLLNEDVSINDLDNPNNFDSLINSIDDTGIDKEIVVETTLDLFDDNK